MSQVKPAQAWQLAVRPSQVAVAAPGRERDGARTRPITAAWAAGVPTDFGKTPTPSAIWPPKTADAELAIGSADDPLEHEADRVADQVMRMPSPDCPLSVGLTQISRKCGAGETHEEAPTTRHAPSTPPGAAAGKAPAIVHDVLRSSGRPLDKASRTFFEPRFGRDFAHIRIHTDARAAESAAGVGALAYTTGPHIVFDAGQYAPATNAGKALLAHELAHTVQHFAHGSAAAVVSRRVADVRCPANQFGAPADPRTDLETADRIAIDLSTKTSVGLAADAQTVQGGIPGAPSVTLRAYIAHFGLPNASGTGFLNRMTGDVRPSREIALSEELSVVSRRFALVAGLLTQGLSYTCPGNKPVIGGGCDPGTCVGSDALSCPGYSYVSLCETFWTNFGRFARAQTIVHEGFHIYFGSILDATTRGPGRNFNIAGCYEALLADQTGSQSAQCPNPPGS